MKIEVELRPCRVNNKKALFHMWSERNKIIPQAFIGGNCGGIKRETVGVIEYESGIVEEVLVREIQFLDNKFDEYYYVN